MVQCFLYGGLMSGDVQDRLGFHPTSQRVATLTGFKLSISPLVNLVPSPLSVVFGLLVEVSHAQLGAVYDQLAARYMPWPVSVAVANGEFAPALCYIAADLETGQATVEHISPLIAVAKELHFPAWYLSRIQSFLPS